MNPPASFSGRIVPGLFALLLVSCTAGVAPTVTPAISSTSVPLTGDTVFVVHAPPLAGAGDSASTTPVPTGPWYGGLWDTLTEEGQ